MVGLDWVSVYAGGLIVSAFFMVIIRLSTTVGVDANQKFIMILCVPLWPIMLPFLVWSAIAQANKNKPTVTIVEPVKKNKGKNNDRNYH